MLFPKLYVRDKWRLSDWLLNCVQDVHLVDAAVDAVAHGHVDEAVGAANGDRGLGPGLGQGEEAGAGTTSPESQPPRTSDPLSRSGPAIVRQGTGMHRDPLKEAQCLGNSLAKKGFMGRRASLRPWWRPWRQLLPLLLQVRVTGIPVDQQAHVGQAAF